MRWRSLVLVFALCGLFGCGRSAPVAYYIFESNQPAQTVDRLGGEIFGIARVTIPEYLDRSGIVSRADGQAQLSIAQFHCWAEPLSRSIARVFREEYGAVFLSRGIAVEDDSAQRATWQLFLDVERLDGALGDKAFLIVDWTLKRGGAALGKGVAADEIAVEGGTHADLVRAQSRLVHRTARRLAEVASQLTGGAP